jgi:hypothetical protein
VPERDLLQEFLRAPGELWIGANYFPTEWDEGLVDGYECVWSDDAQIGGGLCNHEKLFGLRFAVPEDDPLAAVVNRYYSSNIPGFNPPDDAPSLEDIVEVRGKLADIGLELDPVHYFRLAEAYVPLEPKSAWAYAARRSFLLLTREASYGEPTPMHAPSFMGLRSWDDVDAYLRAAWLQAESAFHHPLAPAFWHAMAVFPNSD